MDQDFKTIIENWCENNLSDGQAEDCQVVAVSKAELDRLHHTATRACDILDSLVGSYSLFHIMIGNLKTEADAMGFDREAALYTDILESTQMHELHDGIIKADDFLIGDSDI